MSLPPPIEHCVRHPNVVTGRHCTRCDRPACNECLIQADVGSHCIDCVRRARPAQRERMRYWSAARPDLATRALVAVNVMVYVWVVSGRLTGSTIGTFNDREIRIGLSQVFIDNGEWYRLISCGFLHFGLLHLGMNMLLLWQLGQILEPALGRSKYLLLYLAALIGGSTGALLLSPNALTGGASGAVFGLMAAAAVGLQQRGVNPLRTGIGATLILNLLITFAIPGISVGGHLGGAIIGGAVGYAMLEPRWNRSTPWAAWVAPVIAIVSCVAVVATLP
jgi:membrane associated rhomboid family serine protease